ncbi:hypothetical protein SPB21_04045 [Leptothoe sp. ISB3NOV94-8A]
MSAPSPSLRVEIKEGFPLSSLADSPLLKIPPVKEWAATGKIKGVVFMSSYVSISFFDEADMELVESQLSEYVPSNQLKLEAESREPQSVRIYFKPKGLAE